MTHPHFRHQRGITLVESLLAFVVLGIGVLALLRVQPELRQHAELGRQRSEAVRLAREEIEGLRILAQRDGVATLADAARPVEADVLGSPRYTVQRRVEVQAWPRTRAVEVIVTWDDRRGEAQELKLFTLIAAHEPALAAARLLPR